MMSESSTTDPASTVHRVVIVGAGFAGLFAAKQLRHEDVRVTVIDRKPYHEFQPLLYQVATGILSEGEVAPSIRSVLRGQRNAEVLLGDVTSVDLDARTVRSESLGVTTETGYDSLIVATGSGQSYFGNDEFQRHAPGMKTIEDALALRAKIFTAFERAELTVDESERAAWLTFVVVGGGPTGVEMAGQLAEMTRRSLSGQFRRFDPATETRILLVEAGDGVLHSYGERLSGAARKALTRLGVEVHTGTKVVDIDETAVRLRDSDGTVATIATRTKIWAAGTSTGPLAADLATATGTETTKSGQLRVRPDCTLAGHPEVFVVGDMMRLGETAGLAQVAIQSGTHAARQIRDRLRGRPGDAAFRYRDKGSMAVVSRFQAVADIGRLRLSGPIAWLLWLAVHLFYLNGFRNRVAALLDWTRSFLGSEYGERTFGPPPHLPAAASHHDTPDRYAPARTAG
jgi:NADH:ubiquinone reductase (H+-translocating)